jgi:serine protease
VAAGAAAIVLLTGVPSAAFATVAIASARNQRLTTIAAVHRADSYRHGLIPMLGSASKQSIAAGMGSSDPMDNLTYGGGLDGVGVTTGPARVYLVFWGKQWGTASKDAQGYVTYSGDPAGIAPRLQSFFKGVGTGNDTWSGVMTQYCQGVPAGATTCPPSAQHVAYPTGGALAGVWEDSDSSSPAKSTAHQIGVEAVRAATHFSNTNAVSNRDTQYVIVSPKGTNPDGYLYTYCAWHDYTGDTTLDGGGAVPSPDGLLAFTNMPYVTDAATGCGKNFVNPGSAGLLDGVTLVAGHEYAETITDQYPAGGWIDISGQEIADKCVWISKGQGAAADVRFTTGTFAVQSTWSNDFNGGLGGCQLYHSVFQHGDTVTILNPGGAESLVGKPVTLQVQASDSVASQHLTYSAMHLPTGMSINGGTGLISGTPATEGSFAASVTAKDSTGALATVTFSWMVISSGVCTARQLLTNPGFETGDLAPWSGDYVAVSRNVPGYTAHSGNWFAWLEGFGVPNTESLSQTVLISPACHHVTATFWNYIDTFESGSRSCDTMTVQIFTGAIPHTLASYTNLYPTDKWIRRSYDLSEFAGHVVTLAFLGVEKDTGGGTTDFLIDDTAVQEAS